jgi:acetolactate synthase-1/2/3 large subunit
LVFNDSAYGVLRPQQRARYGRTYAVDLVNPDFVALAHAFGVRGQRVESIDQLAPALSAAVAVDGPCLIELPWALPWPPLEHVDKTFTDA